MEDYGLRIKKGEGAAEWRITDYGLRRANALQDGGLRIKD
jgi:hypothetical protein